MPVTIKDFTKILAGFPFHDMGHMSSCGNNPFMPTQGKHKKMHFAPHSTVCTSAKCSLYSSNGKP